MSGDIRERLLRILRLAQQGVGGERENAEVLLAKLLKKHGLAREDLERSAEPREIVLLPARNDEERTLLSSLVCSICGRGRQQWLSKRRRGVLGVEATRAEGVALTIAWEVILPAWHGARQDLLLAFCWRNELYDPTPRDDTEPLSKEDEERAKRAGALVSSLERVARPAPRLTRRAAQ